MKPIAVVIGGGGYNDMGLVRSCGEAGMDVILITPQNIIIPINKSKYVIEWIPSINQDKDFLIKTLNYLKSKFKDRKIIIFPASDKAALICDECYNIVDKNIVLPNTKGNLLHLMDKGTQVKIANKCNLLAPYSETFNLLENRYPHFNFPCIIKPKRSIFGEKGDITICNGLESYKETLDKYYSKGFYDIIIQDLVEGNDLHEFALTGVSINEDVIISGIIKKNRIIGNGSTVFGEFKVFDNISLLDKVKAFIRETGFQGIFDMEFLQNEEGYHFIECNFRNGAYGYATTYAGFNMPYYYVLASLSKSLPPIKIKEITFMEERADFLNVKYGDLSFWKWIKDLFSSDILLWWNWKDPKPLFRIPHFIKKFFNNKI